MTYRDTEVALNLKTINDLIYKTTKRFFASKSENVRHNLQTELQFLNKAADEYARIRQQEIEEERREPLELDSGLTINKGLFIDVQTKCQLSDEETSTYITMCHLDRINNTF